MEDYSKTYKPKNRAEERKERIGNLRRMLGDLPVLSVLQHIEIRDFMHLIRLIGGHGRSITNKDLEMLEGALQAAQSTQHKISITASFPPDITPQNMHETAEELVKEFEAIGPGVFALIMEYAEFGEFSAAVKLADENEINWLDSKRVAMLVRLLQRIEEGERSFN